MFSVGDVGVVGFEDVVFLLELGVVDFGRSFAVFRDVCPYGYLLEEACCVVSEFRVGKHVFIFPVSDALCAETVFSE